ncbi:MAG TPA: class I adenylate-forming enzyme family protein [Geminicoccaceae bacterium]|nr:class I adenylate-forming enzyme family protein [Geminicoccaceae bacterium]
MPIGEIVVPLSGPPLAEPIDVRNILARGLEAKPDEVALASAEGGHTWRELDLASGRLAANMLEIGVRKGDRVASLMPNRNALIIHYLACFKARFVATPLNYRYMPPEIDHALEVSEASILLAHAERDEDLAASKLATRLPLGVIRYGARDGRSPSFEELTRRAPGQPEIPAPSLSDPAVIFFTSGSTGKPKGVTHSFETLGWVLAAWLKGYDTTAHDVILPGSSISHIGGYGHSLFGLAAGARVLVARTFDGDELLPLLREHRPTILMMLPAALIALVRDHEAKREDFSSVRLCLSGGDKVSAELEREFTDLAGFPIDEIYGMSEIGVSNLNPPSGINKLGSVGPANAGYALSIRDDDGRELPVGGEGRLWVRSPCNMVGYWNRPDATAETIKDGWLDTGDVMRADEDGYLWFCGRKKQIIVHDGSNICPQEVEEALLEHDAVQDAGVVGIHDLVHGENVRAYITLKEGAKQPTSQELIRFARARIGYKAPEEIVVLDAMPLNATGKVDRVALKRMAEERARS